MMQLSKRMYIATFSITAGFLINLAPLCGKIIQFQEERVEWQSQCWKKKKTKDNSVYSHFYLNANKKTALRQK